MSSIGSIGGSSAMMMQGMRSMQRPDPAQMADNLFSKLDTSGQGYLTKSDLQSALDNVSSASSSTTSSSASSSTDSLFSQLDTNGDGKVTKQEFSDTLKKVAEQLDNQFMSMRMNGGGTQGGGGVSDMGGMPPPPQAGQGGQNDSGFTKDQLTSQLKEIGSSDSQRSSLISNVVNNFDKADTNGDGKVSFKEAMAFDQSTSASSSSASTTSTTSSDSGSSTSSSISTNDLSSQMLQQIMKLLQAYGSDQTGSNSLISTLSVTA